MAKLANSCIGIFRRIQNSPWIYYNSKKANILIALGFLTFIIITIDLNSEMAVEKDEITQVITVLENSIDNLFQNNIDLLGINLIKIGIVQTLEADIPQQEKLTNIKERSPPIAS